MILQAFEVYPRLFVSDWRVAASEKRLTQLGVVLVVNMAEEVDDPEPHSLRGKVRFVKFGIWDAGPQHLDFDERALVVRRVHLAVEEIQSGIAAGPVLVHCNAGLSRSVVTAMAWLHRHQDMSWEDAEKRLFKTHPGARLHNVDLRRHVQEWLPGGGASLM
ncbi:MAG TPA: dual specificity protein phosphatase [Thermoplasmata archaeon]|nr:dual specificity protein phosphatase [Thermoplasmata archaeon]